MSILRKFIIQFCLVAPLVGVIGCAHQKPNPTVNEAAKFDRNLVRESVSFEDGAKEGAIVPEVSAPRLKAIWVPEKIDASGTRLIEAHREWILEGDIILLGTPQKETVRKNKQGNAP